MLSSSRLSIAAAAFLYASLCLVGVRADSSKATWYDPNGGQGACGSSLQNSDHVVALPESRYDGGSHCWKRIGIHYQGKYVEATVGDMCPDCDWDHIDITEGTFQQLSNLGDGVIQVSWDFI
ncbi:hypothetical protein K435DRAFT_867134 [Dendrothele bispora CBS 962.96]|uniref:RlpA-like protein double-psi beta-barrel domain-containing protein n=1 Tax=Dendrothele bispora (strain CBS 962.96) TaxID=1314807 RepID=A0A4S8LF88_DENBC|nr:hypothetical protein K435DRAFT_867134 [Dendrothele bispora CBS 962.96]